MSGRRLQPSIYFDRGRRPPPCFRLLLLNVAPNAAPPDIAQTLADIHAMLGALPRGDVRGLTGQPKRHQEASAQQFSGLEHLIGFGRRLFDNEIHDRKIISAARPEFLSYLPEDGPFPALQWAATRGDANPGEADIVIQLTSDHPSGVNVAATEVWKLFADPKAPLQIVATFDGFGRHDGRGWLGFHDGVSNIGTSQRAAALEAPADPAWMEGGTYMAFLRLAINLPTWQRLSRTEQELLIGRDKLSGAPLVATEFDDEGRLQPVVAALPEAELTGRRLADHIDPPQTTDPIVEASHIHRANQNRASPHAPGGLRIFRQGYDYLEHLNGHQPRLGLNFVSYQRDLASLHHLLHLPGWLGDVNFGGPVEPGPGEPEPVHVLSVEAGGFYAVPPLQDPFPGAVCFG